MSENSKEDGRTVLDRERVRSTEEFFLIFSVFWYILYLPYCFGTCVTSRSEVTQEVTQKFQGVIRK